MNERIVNKRAYFEYEILDKYNAGIMLTGTEVKSVRVGNVNMGDAYCTFSQNKLIVKNLHISVWKQGSYNNHTPLRDKLLLLTKTEIKKLLNKVKDKGITIIPLEIFFSETGFVKMTIGLAKGKKTYDKREAIKEREVKRNINRNSDE